MIATEAPLKCGFYALELGGLVAVIFIDWELYIIPDELNAYLLIVAVAFRLIDHSLLEGLKGGLLGWGLLWGIAVLGRIGFGKDAMGHGDIKMMRGVGFLLGMLLVSASLAMAVLVGLVVGVAMIIYDKRKTQTQSQQASDEEFTDIPPESIPSLFLCGAWYLLCLDILALPFPALEKNFVEKVLKQEIQEETIDDDWKPSLTTIPFGPYLAAGAIVCMLFANPVTNAISEWWKSSTGGAAATTSSINIQERFDRQLPSQSYRRTNLPVGVEPTCFLEKGVGRAVLEPIIGYKRSKTVMNFIHRPSTPKGNNDTFKAVEFHGEGGALYT
jgi:leader peptidase (prepilin peptidase)/N-methyltransferase